VGEAENVELMRTGYERWNATGELPVELFHPDIVWDNPVGAERRVYHGIEGALQNMSDLLESFEYIRNEPEQVVGRGDLVVVVSLTTIRGRGSGIDFTNRAAHVWTVQRGVATRFEVYEDVEEALQLVS
jgi:ketosteroid isomerase-like protein